MNDDEIKSHRDAIAAAPAKITMAVGYGHSESDAEVFYRAARTGWPASLDALEAALRELVDIRAAFTQPSSMPHDALLAWIRGVLDEMVNANRVAAERQSAIDHEAHHRRKAEAELDLAKHETGRMDDGKGRLADVVADMRDRIATLESALDMSAAGCRRIAAALGVRTDESFDAIECEAGCLRERVVALEKVTEFADHNLACDVMCKDVCDCGFDAARKSAGLDG